MVIFNSHLQSGENFSLKPRAEVVVDFHQKRRIVNSSEVHPLVLRRAADGPLDEQEISSLHQNINTGSTRFLEKAFQSIRSYWR
mmetsp:Transcript_15071/g.23155  ORF Transcript_15071/g.23155 Transcript_15071/m.23155 type:complete len:84 (-) Transcript_15071:1586-1837(-)